MQTALSRVWTQVAGSIFYDDNQSGPSIVNDITLSHIEITLEACWLIYDILPVGRA